MCLIIQRDAGVIIPKKEFLTAVENNPDGYGLSVPDSDGKLFTLRSLNTEPEELYSLIHGDFKDDKLVLHLRYNTAGETILRNTHPFPILEKDTDGVDLRMAHNGTIHSFKHIGQSDRKWESDTRNFVRSYVRPLVKRFARGVDPKTVLEDEFLRELLSDKIPASSVLSFIDGVGNTLEVHPLGNGGEYREGYWISNKYSFNPKHRTPTTYQNQYQNGGSYSGYDWDDFYRKDSEKEQRRLKEEKEKKEKGSQSALTNNPSPSYSQQRKAFAEECYVERFTKKYNMTEEDLAIISDKTLDAMAHEAPEDMLLLVKELLNINYTLDVDCKRLQSALDAARGKKK